MQSLITSTGGIAGLYVCGDVFTYRGMHRPEIQPAKAVYLRLYSGFIPTALGIAAQILRKRKSGPDNLPVCLAKSIQCLTDSESQNWPKVPHQGDNMNWQLLYLQSLSRIIEHAVHALYTIVAEIGSKSGPQSARSHNVLSRA